MIARRLSVFLAAGTIVLAACGGSGSNDDSADPADGAEVETGSPATPPAAEPTDAPISEPVPAETEPTDAPSSAPAPGPTEAPSPGSAPEPTDAPVAVPTALDFTAQTLDGSEIEMGQFAGRPVLLWFWAPW